VSTTSKVDDLHLTNTLNIDVTYNGEPYGNAKVLVTQIGTLHTETYSTSTDQYGKASITVFSNFPEWSKLDIKVSKDEFNYVEQKVSYIVGALWIVAIVFAVILIAVFTLFRICRIGVWGLKN